MVDGIQLTLKRWHSLPSLVTNSHIQILHVFQQFVELQEASHIYLGVAPTGSQTKNKIQAMQELKGTLGTWRDRLPNSWDDINIWSELVAWRQHVFSVINKAQQPAVANEQQQAGNSLAYRGYHEIAWIINRFAHVARKHHLVDVCINALTKIYTLPNIGMSRTTNI
jgi:transformation/transcription domain-associated protein